MQYLIKLLQKTRDLRNFLLFDCIFITFLHITRLLLVFSQLNMVVGQPFCQLYTTVITMKCLSNNQTFIPFHEQFCEKIHFNTRTAK